METEGWFQHRLFFISLSLTFWAAANTPLLVRGIFATTSKILSFRNFAFYFWNSMDFGENKCLSIHCNSNIETLSKIPSHTLTALLVRLPTWKSYVNKVQVSNPLKLTTWIMYMSPSHMDWFFKKYLPSNVFFFLQPNLNTKNSCSLFFVHRHNPSEGETIHKKSYSFSICHNPSAQMNLQTWFLILCFLHHHKEDDIIIFPPNINLKTKVQVWTP